jgi:hypothetical protein
MKKLKIILPAIAIVVAITASGVSNSAHLRTGIDVTNDNIAPCDAIGVCVLVASYPRCSVQAGVDLYKASDCTTKVLEHGDYISY